jgi:hypothetical protein
MLERMRLAATIALAPIGLACWSGVGAETVVVKYRGPVDLAHMSCEPLARSSFIRRLCYDAKAKYVVVALNDTYYHYCGMPADVLASWRAAESMGHFYNAQVKGRFDCRQGYVPSY